MAPMIEVIKGASFKWIPKAQYSFEEVKLKLTQAPVRNYLIQEEGIPLTTRSSMLLYAISSIGAIIWWLLSLFYTPIMRP